MRFSTQPHDSSPDPRAQPLNIIVLAMAGSLVMLGIVLAVLGAELTVPETWMLLVVAVATLGAWALVLLLPTTPPRPGGSVSAAVQTLTILRVAVLEAPAILGLALAFVSMPTNLTIYLLPALFSLGGIFLFARPSVVRDRVESRR